MTDKRGLPYSHTYTPTHLPTNQPTHNPINPNGIHEALERSGVVHRQRESFPSEPAPELEAKRPPPQPKMTVMGGSGGEMIKAVICVNPATTTTTNNDAAAAELLLNWPKSNKQIAILFYFISSWSLTH